MGVINHPIVGKVSFGVGSGGKLILPDGWAAIHIGTALIPQLQGVATYGGKFSGKVRFFKPAIPQLVAAFAEVERLDLKSKILFWDGSFVPRLKRGGSTPSNHSFGTAFDINAQWNPFRRKPAAPGAKGDLHAVAQVFKSFGFTWGGDWKNTPDGMHFEINRLMSPLELESLTREQSVYVPGDTSAKEAAPALILVTKNDEGSLKYHRLQTISHSEGHFYADKGEVLSVLFGGTGRVPVAEYLEKLGTPEFAPRGDHLNDPKEPRMYLFIETR
jgi:hypothetical protein